MSLRRCATGKQTVWLGASASMPPRTREELKRAVWWLDMIACEDDVGARGRARVKGKQLDAFYEGFVRLATGNRDFVLPPSFRILAHG